MPNSPPLSFSEIPPRLDITNDSTETTVAGIGPLIMSTPRSGLLEFSMVGKDQAPPHFMSLLSPFIWTVLLAYPIYVMASRAFSVGGTVLDAIVLGIISFFAIGRPISLLIEKLRARKGKTQIRLRLSENASRIYIDGAKIVYNFAEIENIVVKRKHSGRLRLILASPKGDLAIEEAWGSNEEEELVKHAQTIVQFTAKKLLRVEEDR